MAEAVEGRVPVVADNTVEAEEPALVEVAEGNMALAVVDTEQVPVDMGLVLGLEPEA